MKSKQFENNVKFVKTQFGLQASFSIPEDCDIIIVCTNDGYGLKTVDLKLPHQLYKKRITELQSKLFGDFGEITVIPARSKDYITISEKVWKNVPKRKTKDRP